MLQALACSSFMRSGVHDVMNSHKRDPKHALLWPGTFPSFPEASEENV